MDREGEAAAADSHKPSSQPGPLYVILRRFARLCPFLALVCYASEVIQCSSVKIRPPTYAILQICGEERARAEEKGG